MACQNFRLRSLFILAGLIVLGFSCKNQKEEIITDTPTPENYIRLSDAQIQLANINVAEVREGQIGRKLSLTGVLKINEQSAATISARGQGRIEKLFFKNTGETVKKGDMLYEFYSEELVSAQREYVNLQSNNWNFSGIYEPSLILKDKLMVLGLMPAQIKQLEKDGKILFRVIIYSPSSGKIRSINVSEGEYVNEGQPLFELAEDNDLWVEAQVYPDEIQYFNTGMPAIVIVPAAGEVPVLRNITFINPSIEKGRNVTIVRAVINNPDRRLHPGMFAIISVRTQISHGIVIPSSAVLTGAEGSRVWIRDENGDFYGKNIKTGIQSEDSILVLSGLQKSDKVVISGAYLLNSEFILRQGSIEPETEELYHLTGHKNM